MFLLWLNQLICLKVALELSGRASCWIAFWSSFAPSFVRLQTVLILPLRNVPITGHSRSIGVSHALVRVVVSWAGVNRPPCMLWHIRAQRSWTYVKAVVPGAQFEVLHTTTPVRIRNRVGVQKCIWRLQRYRPVHHFRLFVTCNQADLSTWSNRHPRQKQKEKLFGFCCGRLDCCPIPFLDKPGSNLERERWFNGVQRGRCTFRLSVREFAHFTSRLLSYLMWMVTSLSYCSGILFFRTSSLCPKHFLEGLPWSRMITCRRRASLVSLPQSKRAAVLVQNLLVQLQKSMIWRQKCGLKLVKGSLLAILEACGPWFLTVL